MPPAPALSLAEHVVLAVVDEGATHGFAVAALTGQGGDLGRVWQLPKPVVYRALTRLDELGLVAARPAEAGRGPRRRPYATTTAGRTATRAWLATPVEHVRDVRSHLLLKLALLHRRGDDPAPLLQEQRRVLRPIVGALREPGSGTATTGFDAVLAAWRRANAAATMAFLDELTDP